MCKISAVPQAARPRPKGQQDLARVRAPFSTPVHGHGARVLPSNGTLPGGAPAGRAVRGAHRAWPGAGGQRRPLSQLPQRSDRQRRIYSAGLPFKSCIESNSRQAYIILRRLRAWRGSMFANSLSDPQLGIRGSVLLAGPLGSGAAARPAPPDRVHRRDRGPVDEITALQLMG